MSKPNPFDTDDVNPFTEVNAYNPFAPASKPSSSPAPASNPFGPSSSQAKPSSSGLKFDNASVPDSRPSFYDSGPMKPAANDLENFFVEDSSSFPPPKSEIKVNLIPAADKQRSAAPPPAPAGAQTTTTAGGARVTVSRGDSVDPDKDLSIFSLEYYQQFFNVDTMDVVWRCLHSCWPFKFTFVANAKNNPDMYGPFWITTTLIFMMAAAGNFAQYLGNSSGWHYDFFKVTYGAGVIYGYAVIIPLIFWGYLQWMDIKMGLSEVLCIYGYSLFIYIFVAVLCVVPFSWLQWTVVSVGAAISTAFLIFNLWQPIREKMAYSIIVLIVLTALHLGLALTFRLYFFQFVPQVELAPAPVATPTA